MVQGLSNKLVDKSVEQLTKNAKMVSGFAPVGTAVFAPVLLNREYKAKNMPVDKRRMLVLQEALAQTVNLTIHAICFLGLMKLTGKVIKKSKPLIEMRQQAEKVNKKQIIQQWDEALRLGKPIPEDVQRAKHALDQWDDAQRKIGITEAIAANVGSFMGMSFLRPVVSAKLLDKWMNRGRPNGNAPAQPVPLMGGAAVSQPGAQQSVSRPPAAAAVPPPRVASPQPGMYAPRPQLPSPGLASPSLAMSPAFKPPAGFNPFMAPFPQPPVRPQ